MSMLRRDRAMTATTIMLDVSFHAGADRTVSAAGIAERLGLARRGMEPLLQALSRAGLLESVRGPRGGYRLGRPARDIFVSDIATAVRADADDCAATIGGPLMAEVVEPLWAELDAALATHAGKVTLAALLNRAGEAGLRRPMAEPIAYVI